MSVTYLNYAAGQIPRSGGIPSSGFDLASITFYNNTPAFLAVFQDLPSIPATGLPGGGVIIPPFYPQTIPVVGWRSFYFVTDGAAMFPTSSLVIQAQDSQAPTLPLSPFGTSAWGAGADPGGLTQINPGDQILAWQLRQFYFALTGAFNVNIVTGTFSNTGGASFGALGQLFIDTLGNLTDALGAATFGAITSLGRISSAAVGVSGKPLLNTVIVSPRVLTTIPVANFGSGQHNLVTLTGLPASAVAAFVTAVYLGPGGMTYPVSLELYAGSGGSTDTLAIDSESVNPGDYGPNGLIPCANSQVGMFTFWTAGAPTGVQLRLSGYLEAA